MMFVILLLAGIILVCYLSWVSSPQMGSIGFLPGSLARWTDARENATIRTGVPFLILGWLTGTELSLKGGKLLWWVISWLLFVVVVSVAEFGQLFLPYRSFDWKDILWGAVGAAAGLVAGELSGLLVRIFRWHR